MTETLTTSGPQRVVHTLRNRRQPTAPQLWEHRVLRLVAEQYAIPLDQLARFLDCEVEQAFRIARHLTRAGYAYYGRVLFGEAAWLWLRPRGMRASGTGFGYCQLRVGAMARHRAVNEVRLHITARAPEARWICSRTLVRDFGMRGYVPNAVVEFEDERHAMLVIPRTQEMSRIQDRLETMMARHDALIAFGPPPVTKLLERLQADHHWPKLVVRGVPTQTGS